MKDLLAAKDARLEELESKITQQQEVNVALQQKIDSLFSNFPTHSTVDNKVKTAVAAAAMPKSCAELRYLGHVASGLYLIMGTDKVETVFCDFSVLPTNPSKITFQIFTFNLQIPKLFNISIK